MRTTQNTAFIYRTKLNTTKTQGIPTEQDWEQAKRVVSDLTSGRPVFMRRFHTTDDRLFEVRSSRKNRLIFQKTMVGDREVYVLTTFEVDHNHKKLIKQNQASQQVKLPFQSLDDEHLKQKGYSKAASNQRISIFDTNAAMAAPYHEGVYYQNYFTAPDSAQQNLLQSEFVSGAYLLSAPAGAGKTFCGAGLIQRFYSEVVAEFENLSLQHDQDDDGERFTKRHIVYITQSERLVQRERENFLGWDADFEENPAVVVEFYRMIFLLIAHSQTIHMQNI